MRILLIDDDPVEEKLFRAMIRQHGRDDIDLVCVSSIDEATAYLDAEEVDIVFLDNRLSPHRSFRETVPRLRAGCELPRLVLLSATIMDINQHETARFGIERVVDKFDVRDIVFGDLLAADPGSERGAGLHL